MTTSKKIGLSPTEVKCIIEVIEDRLYAAEDISGREYSYLPERDKFILGLIKDKLEGLYK